ncbi:hypothetical protein CF326_g6276 [Tilletia indica]|nr:hypothetical protein CF326_g6276 [Tilletia indica]
MSAPRVPLGHVDLNARRASALPPLQQSQTTSTSEPPSKRRRLIAHVCRSTSSTSALPQEYHDGPSTRSQSKSTGQERNSPSEAQRSEPPAQKNRKKSGPTAPSPRSSSTASRPSPKHTAKATDTKPPIIRTPDASRKKSQQPTKVNRCASEMLADASSSLNVSGSNPLAPKKRSGKSSRAPKLNPKATRTAPAASLAPAPATLVTPMPIPNSAPAISDNSASLESSQSRLKRPKAKPSSRTTMPSSTPRIGDPSALLPSHSHHAQISDSTLTNTTTSGSPAKKLRSSCSINQDSVKSSIAAPVSLAHLSGQRLRVRRSAPGILDRKSLIAALRTASKNLNLTPKDWQLEACYRMLAGWDGIVAAGTGTGKSLVWCLAALAAKTSTLLVVTPLKAIQNEQVRNLRRLGIKAVALNENTLRANNTRTLLGRLQHKRHRPARRDVLLQIIQGRVQVVLASPETLLRNPRVSKLIYTTPWAKSLVGVFVDEAHVVDDWGREQMNRGGKDAAPFRPEYGKIGLIRARFGASVPVIALSATLPSSTLREVFHGLEFGRLPFFALDVGVEREATSYEVEPMKYSARSYADLAELFDHGACSPSDLPQTLVYVNTRKEASTAAAALKRLMPSIFHSSITSITALSSDHHKRKVLKHLFPCGKIRVLIATEAVGMGVDLPSVDMVVQWRLPKNFKTLVQHFGRGARRIGQRARAVLLMDHRQLNQLRAEEVSTELESTSSSDDHPKHDPLLRNWVTSQSCQQKALRYTLKLDFDRLRSLLGTSTAVAAKDIIGREPLPQPLSGGDLPVFFWERNQDSVSATSASNNCCIPCGLSIGPLRRWQAPESHTRNCVRLPRTRLYPEFTQLRSSLEVLIVEWRENRAQDSGLCSFMGNYVIMEDTVMEDLIDHASRIIARHLYEQAIDERFTNELLGPLSGVQPEQIPSLSAVLLRWAKQNGTPLLFDSLTPTGQIHPRKRAALSLATLTPDAQVQPK